MIDGAGHQRTPSVPSCGAIPNSYRAAADADAQTVDAERAHRRDRARHAGALAIGASTTCCARSFPRSTTSACIGCTAQTNLAVRKRKKAKRASSERMPLRPATQRQRGVEYGLRERRLANGRRIKCLTVVDDFSHECVDIAVDYGIGGQYVTRLLDRAASSAAYPTRVRTDNGPEFTSRAFMAWAHSTWRAAS